MKSVCIVLLSLASVITWSQDLPRWELGPFSRGDDPKPILGPNPSAFWETGGVSSPSAIVRDGKVYLFYAGSDKTLWRIGLAVSADGRAFERSAQPLLAPSTDPQRLAELKGGCAAPRVVETEQGVYVMSYVQHGERGSRIAIASSRDLVKWQKHGPAFGEAPLPSPGAGVIVARLVNGKIVAAQIAGRYWMFWGDGKIHLAASTDLARWTTVAEGVLAPRKDEFDADSVSPGVALITERGLLLIYHGRAGNVTCTGQALFDPTQPSRLLLRSRFPSLRPQVPFERSRRGPAVTAITALVPFQEKWLAYYNAVGGNVAVAVFDPAEYWAARNPGLTEPQEAATLPVSRTPPSPPRAMTVAPPSDTRVEGALALRSGWRLTPAANVAADDNAVSLPGFDDSGWWRATVPGTVLTTLVDQGVHPDPFYGLNNLAIPESLNKQAYWYRLKFRPPPELANRHAQLQFEGINYRADIWLNGAFLGAVTGAFRRARFDVTTNLVANADNVLAVKITPPPNPGIPHEQSLRAGPGPNGGQLCKDGPTFLCTEGWNWIPAIRDRCAGLWQDVLLRATGPVALGEVQVVTKLPLPETAPADVFVIVEVQNLTDAPQAGALRGSFEGASFEQKVELQPREKRLVQFDPVRVPKPRLWWPNGYGAPELYRLNLAFLDREGRESDRKRTRFGIRELSYELTAITPLPDWKQRRIEYAPTAERRAPEPSVDVRHNALWQFAPELAMPTLRTNSPAIRELSETNAPPHLVIRVNGQRILIRGGTWGMDDALKRLSRERLEPYIRLHREARLNLIRNWAGQSTSETFYELCDEYGLLVWNDFWISTARWNFDPVDENLFLDNAADTIRRYRNHPSLAIWCGRHEGLPTPRLNEGLRRLVHELDGTRYYQPDSRQLSLMNSGPHSYRPPEAYADLARGFSTELGAPSLPEAETIRAFIPPTEQWPISDTWAYHDWHTSGAGDCSRYLAAITNRFGAVGSLDDFCRKAQMVNYETHRAMFEAWNAKLWEPCSGLIAWMSHPCWPTLNWQLYSWDYDTHATFHAVRKACEPVHIQYAPSTGLVTVVNTTLAPLKSLKATATVHGLDGKPLASTSTNLDLAANCAVTLGKAPTPPSTNTTVWLLRLELRDETLLSRNDYWLANRPEQLQALDTLPRVTLKGQTETRGKWITVKLQNPSLTPALMIRLVLRDPKSGVRILPAYYSDNYFNLLPGEPRIITVEAPRTLTEGVQVTAHGWNIQPSVIR